MTPAEFKEWMKVLGEELPNIVCGVTFIIFFWKWFQED